LDFESETWEQAYRRRKDLWAETTLRLPYLKPGSRVLELGCGNARTAVPLIQKGLAVTALDFSRTAARAASALVRKSDTGDVVLADARLVPFTQSSFDAVIARHVIGHMNASDRKTLTREIARVTKPEGSILFSGFSWEDFRYNQGKPVEEGTFLRGTGISTHYFTEDEVCLLFEPLVCQSIVTERWKIRIRGTDYPRAGINATFKRQIS